MAVGLEPVRASRSLACELPAMRVDAAPLNTSFTFRSLSQPRFVDPLPPPLQFANQRIGVPHQSAVTGMASTAMMQRSPAAPSAGLSPLCPAARGACCFTPRRRPAARGRLQVVAVGWVRITISAAAVLQAHAGSLRLQLSCEMCQA